MGDNGRMHTARRRLLVLAVTLPLASALACSADADPSAEPAPATTSPVTTGANGAEGDIASRYGPALEALGLEISRAGLTADASTEGYVEEGGRHLAVYVTPTDDGDDSPSAYAERIAPLARLLIDRVFADHPEIESFDVCQEQRTGSGEQEPPRTVMLVRRDQAAAATWSDVDLQELRRRAAARPKGLSLVVDDVVAATEAWTAAAPS